MRGLVVAGVVLAIGSISAVSAGEQEDALATAQSASSRLTLEVPAAEVLRWHAISLLADANLTAAKLQDVKGWLETLAIADRLFNQPRTNSADIVDGAMAIRALGKSQGLVDPIYDSQFPLIREALTNRLIDQALAVFDGRPSTLDGLAALRAANGILEFASVDHRLGRLPIILAGEEAAYKTDLEKAAKHEASAVSHWGPDLPVGNPWDVAAGWRTVQDLRVANAIYARNQDTAGLTRTSTELDRATAELNGAMRSNAISVLIATALVTTLWFLVLQRVTRFSAEETWANRAAFLVGGPA
jgi:hypothetical protein